MQDYDTMPYRVERMCIVCGKTFMVKRSVVHKGHGRYCSRPCQYRPALTAEQRFWLRVNKDGPLHPYQPDFGPCWLWAGHTTTAGYGELWVEGVRWLAHRYAYKLVRGCLDRALFACHSCDNPACVNPDHIFLGTQQANLDDCSRKGRTMRGERNARYTHPETTARGERGGNAKLTAEKVRDMRKAHFVDGVPYYRLAAQYGVCKATAREAIVGTTWAHLTD
jgi:hypothetical protein